jgi:triosephosphate isomerase (EC 5.3.1.1)
MPAYTGKHRYIHYYCKGCKAQEIVCTTKVATSVGAPDPDYVAVEPSGLIGSVISVSEVGSGVVTGSVEAVKRINPAVQFLCGAGISKGEDLVRKVWLSFFK